jgi:hypothetical protein
VIHQQQQRVRNCSKFNTGSFFSNVKRGKGIIEISYPGTNRGNETSRGLEVIAEDGGNPKPKQQQQQTSNIGDTPKLTILLSRIYTLNTFIINTG